MLCEFVLVSERRTSQRSPAMPAGAFTHTLIPATDRSGSKAE